MSDDSKYFWTVNYLFATYLQTTEAGSNKIVKVEKIKAGKAKFYFDIPKSKADELQLAFHRSVCNEFESLRKATIDLAYVFVFVLLPFLY
jgi:hypothetical protein